VRITFNVAGKCDTVDRKNFGVKNAKFLSFNFINVPVYEIKLPQKI